MNKIQLLTFKGCQTTLDFLQKLNVMIQAENLDVEIETITVSSLETAEEMGLYGSPTLIINGVGQKIYGDVTGSTCWQKLHQGLSGPCGFCPNDKLIHDESLSGKTYIWENCSTINQRWYSMHDRLLRWVDGALVKIQIAVDITERKDQEIELKGLRNYLSNIIDSMPSILIGADTDGRVIHLSDLGAHPNSSSS